MSNFPLTRPDFLLVRGMQNEVDFFVRDVDRHPVVFTTEVLTVLVSDPATQTLLLSRALVVEDAAQAIYRLIILPGETTGWPTPLRFSVTLTRTDGSVIMLWTSISYDPFSSIRVVDGPMPGAIPSTTLTPSTFTIDSITINGVLNPIWYGPRVASVGASGYSGGAQTLAAYLTNFTGSLELDGSLQADATTANPSQWFALASTSVSAQSGVVTLASTGNYLWVRAVVTPSPLNQGSIPQILLRG